MAGEVMTVDYAASSGVPRPDVRRQSLPQRPSSLSRRPVGVLIRSCS